jgi:hypothetical protein
MDSDIFIRGIMLRALWTERNDIAQHIARLGKWSGHVRSRSHAMISGAFPFFSSLAHGGTAIVPLIPGVMVMPKLAKVHFGRDDINML